MRLGLLESWARAVVPALSTHPLQFSTRPQHVTCSDYHPLCALASPALPPGTHSTLTPNADSSLLDPKDPLPGVCSSNPIWPINSTPAPAPGLCPAPGDGQAPPRRPAPSASKHSAGSGL